MDMESLKYIAIGLMALGMLGAAIGVGNIFASVVSAIARNPSAESKLSKYAFIGAGMAEAMGLFALVIAFMLIFSGNQTAKTAAASAKEPAKVESAAPAAQE
jgi:F-type H+-transporting ATPase subunit c